MILGSYVQLILFGVENNEITEYYLIYPAALEDNLATALKISFYRTSTNLLCVYRAALLSLLSSIIAAPTESALRRLLFCIAFACPKTEEAGSACPI